MLRFLPGPEALVVLGIFVLAPGALAWLVTGGQWLQVAGAFLLWWGGLFLLLGGRSVRREEQLGWTMIMSLFFSWAGVPLAALVLRAADLPYRFL